MYNTALANAILNRLNELFPSSSTSDDLWEFQVKGFEREPKERWLEAIDALLKLKVIEGKVLREGPILVNAANLTITRLGIEQISALRKPNSDAKAKVIFLSHAANDQDIALRLKELIEKVVPGCDVFVSSDTEDIRPGDEWVRRILDTLQIAAMLLILATERSVYRPWVWFEAGTSWRSNLRTIPCCLGKTRKNELPAPFSQYQGLNIDDEKDLRALLGEVSKVVGLPLQETDIQEVVRELQALDQLKRALRVSAIRRDPYDEDLERTVNDLLAELSDDGKRLMRYLLKNEPLDVSRKFLSDVSVDTQVKQFGIAMGLGIVRHREIRVGSGNLLRTEYEISSQYRQILRDLLYSQ